MSRMWAVCAVAMLAAATGASAQDQGPTVSHNTLKIVADRDAAATIGHKMIAVEAPQIAFESRMRMPFETKVVTGAPYSAEVITESTQVLADGNRIVHRTTGRVYRDGQGRVRREEDSDSGRVRSVSITDPVAKVSYWLDPERNVAVKTVTGTGEVFTVRVPHSTADPGEVDTKRLIEEKLEAEQLIKHQQEAEQLIKHKQGEAEQLNKQKQEAEHLALHVRDNVAVTIIEQTRTESPEWDEKIERLSARDIEGVTAEGTRKTRTIPAGRIGNERPIVMVSEEWRSAALGVIVATTSSDPRTGESSYRLLNVARSEPAPNLFEVPSNFTVKESGIRTGVSYKHEER